MRALHNSQYCRHNGWLDPKIVALQHDFDKLEAKAAEVCEALEPRTNWRTMTLNQMSAVYNRGLERETGMPTEEEAVYVGAWTCAMGSAGCDIAYCAYSFCDKGNGEIGTYGECEGWELEPEAHSMRLTRLLWYTR